MTDSTYREGQFILKFDKTFLTYCNSDIVSEEGQQAFSAEILKTDGVIPKDAGL